MLSRPIEIPTQLDTVKSTHKIFSFYSMILKNHDILTRTKKFNEM